MSDDIAAFIQARLDDDEQAARQAIGRTLLSEWELPTSWPSNPALARAYERAVADSGGVLVAAVREQVAEHIASHDPARVLRGVEAKRRLLDEFEPCQACLAGERCVPHDASAGPGISRIASAQHEWFARLLASEWSTHPDYRQQWHLSD